MERILVVRLGAMGDVVHALPAVTALRAAFPAATIGWAIEERWSALLTTRLGQSRGPQQPLVDVVHAVNTQAWRAAPFSDETWREVRAAFGPMRSSRYNVALDFQGSFKSAVVALSSGATSKLGYAAPWERCASLLYTNTVRTAAHHVVEQGLALASSVARRPLHDVPPALPQDEAAGEWAAQELRRRGVQRFAILHPGAGWGAKRWPAERYAEVAAALGARGIQSLVNHGPGEEGLAGEVVGAGGGSASALRCSIGELIALTRAAQVVIGGDTGPLHLAATLRVPVVAIYGPTDPRRTGPWGTRSIVLRSAASATSHARRADAEPGLLDIRAAGVTAAAEKLLESGHG